MARVRKGVGRGSLARKVCIACNDLRGNSLETLNIYLDSQAQLFVLKYFIAKRARVKSWTRLVALHILFCWITYSPIVLGNSRGNLMRG